MRQDIEQMYRRHLFAVFQRCRFLLGDDAEAKDVAHEVFVRLLDAPDAFEGRSSIATYLFAAATNLSFRRLRAIGRRDVEWLSELSYSSTLSEGDGRLERRTIARDFAWKALAEEDELTSQIAIHHLVDGLSQGEVALLTGVSRVTVNQRLQRFYERARALDSERP